MWVCAPLGITTSAWSASRTVDLTGLEIHSVAKERRFFIAWTTSGRTILSQLETLCKQRWPDLKLAAGLFRYRSQSKLLDNAVVRNSLTHGLEGVTVRNWSKRPYRAFPRAIGRLLLNPVTLKQESAAACWHKE